MVLGILVGTYSTWFGLVHQKRGGTLRRLRIKRVCRSWYYFNPPQASSLSYFLRQADRGFATSRLCTDEDGTRYFSRCIFYMVRIGTSKKGGNAPQATDEKSM